MNVVTKYKEAARIANLALEAVLGACAAGAPVVRRPAFQRRSRHGRSTRCAVFRHLPSPHSCCAVPLQLDLCKMGDTLMLEQVSSLYKKEKEMKKGVAYPTCVSINECVCAFSPMDDEVKLSAGDVVKVDLACHVDGYIGAVAGTTVVGCGDAAPATGKAADVIAAAYTGAEAMMRMVKPGASNTDIPGVLEKIAAAHGCTVVEGVLSHQMKRFMIDGEKCILQKPDAENKVDDNEFEVNEVYHLDIAMSTGDGKTRELDEKQRT